MVRRSLPILAAVAFVLAAWLLWSKRPKDEFMASAPSAAPARVALPATAQAVPRATPVASLPVTAAAGTPSSPTPPGLSAEQWGVVETALRGRPDAEAERARLFGYFAWQDAVRRWRADPGESALAATVRAGLPERLARREISAAEARQLEATLLETLEPDPARRAAALDAFDAAQPGAAPDGRSLAFQRAQAAAVAAWTAVPAAQRDPAALKTELDRLRRQHYAQITPVASPETPR